MSSSKTLRLVIKGKVQGVGYRDWLVGQASRLRVCGWVRNTHDGDVEALLCGGACEELVKLARIGPPLAAVDSMSVTEADVEETPRHFIRLPTL